MLHSAYEDRFKGVYYKVSFYAHPDGWTFKLDIEDMPHISDGDFRWKTKEDAHQAATDIAEDMIGR